VDACSCDRTRWPPAPSSCSWLDAAVAAASADAILMTMTSTVPRLAAAARTEEVGGNSCRDQQGRARGGTRPRTLQALRRAGSREGQISVPRQGSAR